MAAGILCSLIRRSSEKWWRFYPKSCHLAAGNEATRESVETALGLNDSLRHRSEKDPNCSQAQTKTEERV
jgi:hypothetical protein